jgi:hypothetical protein
VSYILDALGRPSAIGTYHGFPARYRARKRRPAPPPSLGVGRGGRGARPGWSDHVHASAYAADPSGSCSDDDRASAASARAAEWRPRLCHRRRPTRLPPAPPRARTWAPTRLPPRGRSRSGRRGPRRTGGHAPPAPPPKVAPTGSPRPALVTPGLPAQPPPRPRWPPPRHPRRAPRSRPAPRIAQYPNDQGSRRPSTADAAPRTALPGGGVRATRGGARPDIAPSRLTLVTCSSIGHPAGLVFIKREEGTRGQADWKATTIDRCRSRRKERSCGKGGRGRAAAQAQSVLAPRRRLDTIAVPLGQ